MSPIGNKANAERSASAGFTLVELILVMALLMIVLGVAFPSLKNFFRGRTLDSEARRFLALTRYGQSRAISEGVPMVLWINVPQRSYGLQAQPGYGTTDTNAMKFDLAQDLRLEVAVAPVTVLMQSNVWTQVMVAPATSPTIRLLPDGSIAETSPQRVIFRQNNDDAIWVAESLNRRSYEIQSPSIPSRR